MATAMKRLSDHELEKLFWSALEKGANTIICAAGDVVRCSVALSRTGLRGMIIVVDDTMEDGDVKMARDRGQEILWPETGVMEISLPYATPSQNVYQRWHWGRQMQFRDQCCIVIRAKARALGLPHGNPQKNRMLVEVVRYSAGTLDYGNLVGGCKGVLDALVIEGLIRDDRPEWLHDSYRQEVVPMGEGSTKIRLAPVLNDNVEMGKVAPLQRKQHPGVFENGSKEKGSKA